MKQPFIDSLFNILDLCRQRQNIDEQSGKQTKTTSVWHPIIGHVRGKTSGMTVLVYFQYFFVFCSSENLVFQISSRNCSTCYCSI